MCYDIFAILFKAVISCQFKLSTKSQTAKKVAIWSLKREWNHIFSQIFVLRFQACSVAPLTPGALVWANVKRLGPMKSVRQNLRLNFSPALYLNTSCHVRSRPLCKSSFYTMFFLNLSLQSQLRLGWSNHGLHTVWSFEHCSSNNKYSSRSFRKPWS